MAIKLTCGKGAENLSSDEKMLVDKIAEEYSFKILRHGFEINNFDVHLKCHLKEGKSKRYNIDARLQIGKYRFEANGDEFNLPDALKGVMNKIMSEIEHTLIRNKLNKSWKKKARV